MLQFFKTHNYSTFQRLQLQKNWVIKMDEIRPQLINAIDDVEFQPAFMRKRMFDWLTNMGDWSISRKRYYIEHPKANLIISESNKGRKCSEETREKMRISSARRWKKYRMTKAESRRRREIATVMFQRK
jgi:isoleucyl-tRNA synthetase